MPRRRFLGWEPETVTTVAEDGTTTSVSAPEWDDTDRMFATALQIVERDTCDGCGQPLSETLSQDAEYAASGPPSRCKGCDTLSQSADRHKDSPRPNALRYPIERVDGG